MPRPFRSKRVTGSRTGHIIMKIIPPCRYSASLENWWVYFKLYRNPLLVSWQKFLWVGDLLELRSQRDAHFFVEWAFLFTCKNSKTTNAALICVAALKLRIACKYQLNLIQRGQSSNKDILASTWVTLLALSISHCKRSWDLFDLEKQNIPAEWLPYITAHNWEPILSWIYRHSKSRNLAYKTF